MIVGLGAPCTGTGYTAQTLINSGLDVGHEFLDEDGIVCWTLAVKDGDYPWNAEYWKSSCDWTKIDWESAKIIHVVRSPLASLNSFASHNTNSNLYDFMWSNVNNDPVVEESQDSLINSATLLMEWSELVQSSNPGMIYRVDRPVDNEKLSDFLGVEIKPFHNKTYNSKKESRNYSYTYKDFAKYPEVAVKFADWCDWLGYAEDAKLARSVL